MVAVVVVVSVVRVRGGGAGEEGEGRLEAVAVFFLVGDRGGGDGGGGCKWGEWDGGGGGGGGDDGGEAGDRDVVGVHGGGGCGELGGFLVVCERLVNRRSVDGKNRWRAPWWYIRDCMGEMLMQKQERKGRRMDICTERRRPLSAD